jgi:hypothetical protein
MSQSGTMGHAAAGTTHGATGGTASPVNTGAPEGPETERGGSPVNSSNRINEGQDDNR